MKRATALLVSGLVVGMLAVPVIEERHHGQASIVEAASLVARMIFVQGTVEVQRAGAGPWTAVQRGDELAAQDRVRTGRASLVEIAFDQREDNVVRLGEQAELAIESLAPHQLRLSKGALLSVVKRVPKRSTFEVRTPTAVIGVRGTGWTTETDGRTTEAAAFEDTIFGRGVDPRGNVTGEVDIEEGLKTVFDESGQIGALERITDAEQDRWNEFKEEIGEHIQETEGGTGGGISESAQQAVEQIEQQQETLEQAQESVFESTDEQKIEQRGGEGATSASSSSSSSSSSS